MSESNEIFIYDDIGPEYWGLVSAKYVLGELKRIGNGKDVVVRINSLGGSVEEGQAIYNAFMRHGGNVTMEIDSIAASMASYIAMAGKTINIAENAMIMIHNPWTIGMGDAKEMHHIAGVLEKFQGSTAEVYAARTGKSVEEIADLMNHETWLTAKEAIDAGFADSVGQALNGVSASVKPGRFNKTPKRLIDDSPTPVESARIAARQLKFNRAKQQLAMDRKRLGV